MFESEVRAMFVGYGTMGYDHDWDLIAKTCAEYGINILVIECAYSAGTACYYSDYHLINRHGDQLTPAIQAAHKYGLKAYVLCSNLPGLKPAEDPFHQQMLMVDDNGNPSDTWACPSNPIFREHEHNITEELITKFPDIDGYFFDFIRYPEDHTGWCYCEYCKQAFQEWLGETITDWTPFKRGGNRHIEYLEWRTIPITEIVKDVYSTLKRIKPSIAVGAAVWTYFGDAPVYWRKYLGQDTGRWIKEGYLDFVSPMIYTGDVNEFEDMLIDDLEYMVAGPEGKIPIIPFIDLSRKNTPDSLKQEVEILRNKGADGWIMFRYAGPGSDEPLPDVRDYLSIIDMPPTFRIENVNFTREPSGVRVNWKTTRPASSKIEYSTQPLFYSTWESQYDFHYWRTQKQSEINIIEDPTPKESHSILIPQSGDVYFRVQGSDGVFTLTSKEYYTAEVSPAPTTPWTLLLLIGGIGLIILLGKRGG